MRCCQIFAPMPKMAKPKTTIMSTVIQFAGVQDKIVVSAIVTSNKNSAPSLAHRVEPLVERREDFLFGNHGTHHKRFLSRHIVIVGVEFGERLFQIRRDVLHDSLPVLSAV